MHDVIYQIGLEPIPEEEYVDNDRIYEGEYVSIDYSYELDNERREQVISGLVNSILPKGLFTLNKEDNSLTYMGGLKKWKQAHIDNLINIAKALNTDNVLKYIGPLRDIQMSLNNPLNTMSLFVMDTEGNSGIAENSGDFMRMLDHLNVGDKIYIGAVYGYHF